MAELTLSPELESPYETAWRHMGHLVEWAAANDYERHRNEATTRLHLINKLLEECLAWRPEEITAEDQYKGTYTDYILGRNGAQVVVEAKREDAYFGLPEGFDSRTVSLRTLRDVASDAWAAVEQALGYCLNRGIPIGAVCNGHQLIAFIGSRQDGVPPAEGRAVVFSSLDDMHNSFSELWSYLSRPGVESRRLYAKLQRPTQPPPPEKLASRLVSYPGTKVRNQLQTELQILGDLFLEDVSKHPSLNQQFLEEAYCASGALSQYALVSREILQTRYNAFFADAGDVSQEPATDKKGLAPGLISDVLAASISRRPIILLGDVGVGKTMFIRRLVGVDARELFERAITLYIDFGSEPALSTEIEAFVRRSFVEQLRSTHDIDVYERNFVRGVHHGELERFSRGIYSDLKDTDPGEYRRRELELLQGLISDTEAHLRAAFEHIVKGQQRQIVVFLDNVDQRPLQFQDQVFLIAQALASNWPGTVFVSLRPETFYRSRVKGSLAAYQPRVFTIAPPRIDLVLRRRLEFAQKQLQATGTFQALGPGVSFQSASLNAYIRALLYSLTENDALTELIDNLSGGNVRSALDFLTAFVGSGHVDSEKIVSAVDASGRYLVPVHEFLRAITFGDHQHYDPNSSPVANLFDISLPDEREHFLLPNLIAFVERAGEATGSEGFVEAGAIFDEAQRLGFQPAQAAFALRRGLDKRLLEADLRGLEYGEPERLRITTVGAYTTKKLVKLFTYVDAMIVDTPVVDANVRSLIGDSWAIGERLARADNFRRYLDAAWQPLSSSTPPFDWQAVSADVEDDIERIALRVVA